MPLQTQRTPYHVRLFERVHIVCPHSEVCIHMQVAGKPMLAALVNDRYGSVQLYTLEGDQFSSPIAAAEAGFFYENQVGYYVYPAD